MASSGTVNMRAETGGQRVRGSRVAGRVLRWSAGLIGLFAVVLLMAGIVVGIGLRSAEPPAPVYSAGEQAQLDAEGRYRALAADARAAAALQPALEAALGERLAAVAADLDAQADAVSLPRSPAPAPEGTDAGGASAGSTSAGSTSAGTPIDPVPATGASSSAEVPVDGPRLLSMLRDSALRSLRDAVDAEPGPARVLASAGANQWRQAVLIGQALGTEPGLPAADTLSAADLTADEAGLVAPTGPTSSTGPAPSGGPAGVPAPTSSADPAGANDPADAPAPNSSGDPPGALTPASSADAASPDDCAGTPLGTEADRQALQNAKRAEDEARYGYEVAAALVPDPAAALARSAVHQAAADAAARRLAELCVPVAPAPAGFAIAPAFRADPEAALRELEQDHAELYAGLVSAVGPDVRAWAVASYNAAVQRSLEAGTPLDAFPGLATESGAGSAGDSASATRPGATSAPEDAPAPEGTPAPAGPNGG
ncbi:DUF4439 domain-containing protein [Arthrobacter burdickii]|uniref:DUF4439 domain-containing protein n=1 Tax=Arthrobacter burdickii TaxID=3035920 RepID=A0ABT8K6S9_9MICC|nr:DUF4439 domain-containing protein [Arthrobacter burdickii]MDN4612727.1 DUF4439 domain-containing protein [Arthrobacter burdickii]